MKQKMVLVRKVERYQVKCLIFDTFPLYIYARKSFFIFLFFFIIKVANDQYYKYD